MVKTSVPTRVLSVALAAALSCTLVPAEGIAFADQPAEPIEQSAEAAQAVESAAGDEAVADQAPESAADTAAPEHMSQDVPVAAPAVSGTEGAMEDASAEQPAQADAVEITRTSVSLADEAATVFSTGGLVFQVNADDPDTAACIDWTGAAPQGALQIPAEAVAAGKVYPVTRIMVRGGGVRS